MRKGMGSAARYVHLDVTRLSDWMEAVTAAHDTFSRLTALVNNARVTLRPGGYVGGGI
jgi:3alpha(or 20beta)-hydroxysteroid dehydrogenase